MNFNWVDWLYNLERKVCGKIKNRIMKKSMATHFARMQYLDQYPFLQRNTPFKHGHEANLHNVEKLPLFWQEYIQKNINMLRENMPTYIEE